MGGMLVSIALVAISIVFFIQFSGNKKHFKREMENYENQLKDEIEKRKKIEQQHQNELSNLKTSISSGDGQSGKLEDNKSETDSLFFEVENLRKEKNEELKMRLEAEKQIDLALQKTQDVQRRIDDWKVIQESNLKDATDTISKVGNDLYDRLIKNHKAESEIIHIKVDDTIKNIYDYLEKIVKQVQLLNINNVDSQNTAKAAIGINGNGDFNANHNSHDLEEILKSAHLQSGIDYFMHHDLPEAVKKSVLCEAVIVIDRDNIIIVDIKSIKFFLELFSGRSKNNINIEKVFKQKIDRYLAYLTNQKYRFNILSYFSKQKIISFSAEYSLIMLAPSQKEVDEFNKLGNEYLGALEKNHINLHSLKSFSDLIFGE